MRNVLINTLGKRMDSNKDIYILTGDLWWPFFYEFFEKYPDRCINVGIAEQNMIGIAAGLALEGKKVYCYSIVPFITMRAYEQVRVDICSHNLDVTLIGIWWGFAYGTLWNTHYGIEDINVMRWLPNMQIFCPIDKIEMLAGLEYLEKNRWPTYIRLNRWGEPDVLSEDQDIDISSGVPILESGHDIILLSTGRIGTTAKEVAMRLQDEGKWVSLYSIPLIKPINKEILRSYIKQSQAVFTIEEHTIYGGLGSAVAEIIAESWMRVRFRRIGIDDSFFYIAGDQEYMKKVAGLDVESIYRTINQYL